MGPGPAIGMPIDSGSSLKSAGMGLSEFLYWSYEESFTEPK